MDQFGIKVGLHKKDAFEGWFTKVDDLNSGLMFSVIWGYTTHEETKHAFIQFQDNLNHGTTYLRYPIEAFSWEENPFKLKIGKNMLTKEAMQLDLMLGDKPVRGEFTFSALSTIRSSLLRPNIMGILTFLPNECNHAIISMHHKVNGRLQMGEKTWVIEEAQGYMEKDWGTGFPQEYVWLQVNDWPDSSVVFSYATVPMLGKYAKGFFAVVLHKGCEYRFSSIEGSKLTDFHVTKDAFKATIVKKDFLLHLDAKQFNPVALASPIQGEMKAHIKESLDGTMELKLEKKGERIIQLSSLRASIDVHFNDN